MFECLLLLYYSFAHIYIYIYVTVYLSGSNSLGSGGFVPYPGYDYYLNDMWYYDFSTGYWVEIIPPEGSEVPAGRVDHVMILTEGTGNTSIVFMHGGFADNVFFNDAWYFTLETRRWLEKKEFVYPKYPDSCTDDLETIELFNAEEKSIQVNMSCVEMQFPEHLERTLNYPYTVLDPKAQPHYYPDPEYGPYWNIQIKDRDSSENMAIYGPINLKTDIPVKGTPMFPFAASAPQQYVRPFVYSFNGTRNVLLQRCTSVFAEPTRGKVSIRFHT